MIKIKTVEIGGWNGPLLQSYTNTEIGNIIYTYNHVTSTRDELNNAYLNGKKNKQIIEIKEKETTKEELIKDWEKEIDPYVDYIEDGKQYQSACRWNEKVENLLEEFKKL